MKIARFAAAAVLASPLAANAVPTIHFGQDVGLGEATPLAAFPNSTAAQASFLAGLINPGVETFETRSGGVPQAISFGAAGTATLTGGGNVEIWADGVTNGFGRYGITGDADGDERFWQAGVDFAITFSAPVAAFGFFGIDIGDFNGQVTVTTAGGLNQVFNVGNTVNGPGGGVLFWGLIDTTDTFTSVSFGNTEQGTDFFAFDNFTIGSLAQVRVPEPTSLLLVGGGLAALAAFRRRKSA